MADLIPVAEYSVMIEALEKFEQSTHFEANSIAEADYERDSEFGSITFPGRSNRLELNEWSARQLCKKAGVPFSTFRKASGPLAKSMFAEFIKGIKDPQIKLSVKSFGKKDVLRGVLPTDYPDVRDSDILKAVGALTAPFVVQSAAWMDKVHEPLRRTRFVFPSFNKTINNDDLCLALDITSSEVGAGPLQINLLLYRVVCTNGAIATFGQRPYFYYDYGTSLGFQLLDVVKAALARFPTDLEEFLRRVEAAVGQTLTVEQATETLEGVVKNGLLNKGVAVKALAILETDGCHNMWDLVNAVTSAARGFRDMLRLRYEQAAGLILGLDFKRASHEEDWANKAPTLAPTRMLAAPASTTGN